MHPHLLVIAVLPGGFSTHLLPEHATVAIGVLGEDGIAIVIPLGVDLAWQIQEVIVGPSILFVFPILLLILFGLALYLTRNINNLCLARDVSFSLMLFPDVAP